MLASTEYPEDSGADRFWSTSDPPPKTRAFVARSSFGPLEREVVRIALMEGNITVKPDVEANAWSRGFRRLTAMLVGDRRKGSLANDRLEALRRFTAVVQSGSGALDQGELRRFFRAGYSVRQALEVSLLVAATAISSTDRPSRGQVDEVLNDGVAAFPLLPAITSVAR